MGLRLNGPGTAALNNAFAGRWQASHAYLAGDLVLAPDGTVIQRDADGTSRSTYDATEQALWTVKTGGASGGLTDIAGTVTANGALAVSKHNPVDATSGNRAMTLANATGAGKLVSVEKTDATTNTVTITLNLRGTAGATFALVGQSEAVLLASKADGSWWPVATHKTKAWLDATYADKTKFHTQASGAANPTGVSVLATDTGYVHPSAGSSGVFGGSSSPYQNVIGGDVTTVNTVTSNVPTSTPAMTTPPSWTWIVGGYDNVVNGWACQVQGYHCTIVEGANHCTISGGSAHQITSAVAYGTIGGGTQNVLSGNGGTVSGGYSNTASATQATVGGGLTNTASGTLSTIGGGLSNAASGNYSTISGGNNHTAANQRATIAGGASNSVTADYATIGGGSGNSASATYATIVGGLTNVASGTYATVDGGRENTASASYSVASGWRANATNHGSRAHSAGMFAATGDAQIMDMIYRKQTTDATATAMWLDGVGTRAILPADTTWAVEVLTVARCLSTSESAAFKHQLLVERIGSGTPTIINTPGTGVIATDAAAWTLAFTTGSDGSLRLTATGEAAKTIRWVSRLTVTAVSG